MPTVYMMTWSIVIIFATGAWRLRRWTDIGSVILVTAVILFITHILFQHFSLTAGISTNSTSFDFNLYLRSGLSGWLALLVMPCGWLGPIIGLHLVQKRTDQLLIAQ